MGATPIYGLNFPEDSDPVAAGAQAIKSLAQGVETTLTGLAGDDPLDVYEAFQVLSGNPAYPSARWPFAYTVDPAISQGEVTCNQDQRGVAFMVRRVVSCSAMTYLVTTAATGTISGFIGGTLYQYDAAATWKFLANSGAGKPGSFGNAVGWKILPWRNAGDTADLAVTLNPGTVYVAALTMASWTTTNPKICGAVAAPQSPNNFTRVGGFDRSGIRSPVTAISTGDVLSSARNANGHTPLYALL